MIEKTKGKLIVFEGISGLGKSTQKAMVAEYFMSSGYSVIQTEWNTDLRIGSIIAESKRKKIFTPMVWSMVHATEFLHRYLEVIQPSLEQGYIVLADRYIYTALTRDYLRGVNRSDIENIYSFAQKPEVIIYFTGTPDVALNRVLQCRSFLSFYGSGMDLRYSLDMKESWLIYQSHLQQEYEKVLDKSNTIYINALKDKEAVLQDIIMALKGQGI